VHVAPPSKQEVDVKKPSAHDDPTPESKSVGSHNTLNPYGVCLPGLTGDKCPADKYHPPPDQPKPKPNPNPNQSGSSGSLSDADLADGVSAGEAKGGGGGQKDAGSAGSGSPGAAGSSAGGAQAAGSSGGGSARGAAGAGGGARGSPPSSGTSSDTNQPDQSMLPLPSKPFDPQDLIPYTPAIIPAVVGIGLIAFFLWKYFAYLAKRRRQFRTVRDVPSPPLDEEILQHLQRGEPPPDYGYTMIRDRQPASAAGRRGRRHPRVHKRTIIDLHLEVLNECDAAAWENVKDDYLQILVEEFMGGNNMCTSSSDVCTPDDGLATHDSTTRDVTTAHSTNRDLPIDSDGTDPCPPHDPDPWSCMETIRLEQGPCAPNEDDPDPWKCMETIQLHAEQSRSQPAAIREMRAHHWHTHWINWIDRNKHLLRACTTQPWFLQLKADWKQYVRQHMVATAPSGEHRTAATMERTKLDLWRQWVAQQHRQMRMYCEAQWFQQLLNNVDAATESQNGEVPGVETDLNMQIVTAAADMLQVRDVPRSQPLHQQSYMKKPLTANIWILILALVIEQCEIECRLQEKELYVDDLLQQLVHVAPPSKQEVDVKKPSAHDDPTPESKSVGSHNTLNPYGVCLPGLTGDKCPADKYHPPPDQPKPKPNPNPNQSGSSGSLSDADLADGVSAGEAKGGGGGQKDAGSAGSGSPGAAGSSAGGAQAAGSSGGGSARGAAGAGGGARGSPPSSGTSSDTNQPDQSMLPLPSKPFDPQDLIPYTPAIIPAVVGIGLIAFFLWKYFAYLAKRRRQFRTVRDVPSPPLDEEILQHLQRGEPPPDYGYTMIRDRQPASAAGRRGRRHPRVHKRTIIDLHLEVLNECDAAAWENVKDDYLQILVEEFMGGNNMCTSSSDVCTPDDGLATHDSTTRDVTTAHSTNRDLPIDSDGTDPCPPHDPDPWSCMETIRLEQGPCAPNEDDPDPWKCMETIQLHAEQSRSQPAAIREMRAHHWHTHWINWIDRNKHLLRACTTQPWFLQLKADWKQYVRQHMVATAPSGEHRTAATMERTKLDLWRQWVAQQHRQMRMYCEAQWFQQLLNNVDAATESQNGEVPGVETDLNMQIVTAAADMLQVRDVPRSQPLHQQSYMKKPLTANIWILILALVIEQCEIECRLQEKELYVDDLLQQL
ncbi:hypothetical protein AK88_04626, partial [Plasmodium fragile]